MVTWTRRGLSVLIGVLTVSFLLMTLGGAWAYAGHGSKDKDNDGLTNQEEKEHGTKSKDPDTDDDGLSDGLEVNIGTNPLSADSDDDGLDDGAEVVGSTDPEDPDSDHDGLSDSEDDDNDPIDDEEFESALVPVGIAFTFDKGEVEIEGEHSVEVEMEIKGVRDVTTGYPVSSTGNKLCIEAEINGVAVAPPIEILFDLTNGNAEVEEVLPLGEPGDLLRILAVLLKDPSGAPFATQGIRIGSDDGDDDDDDDDDGDDDDDEDDD